MSTHDAFIRARAQLIMTQPFWGSLALRLKAIEAPGLGTCGTDGTRLWWDPDHFATLDAEQARFILAHEVAHCALQHHTRRGTRDPELWNVAADHAINLMLQDSGFTLLDGVCCDPRFRGMSTEQIYAEILPPPPPPGGSGSESGAGDAGDEGDEGDDESESDAQGDDESDDDEGASQSDEGEPDDDEQQDDSDDEGEDDSDDEGGSEQRDAPDPDAVPDSLRRIPDPTGCGVVIDARAEDGGKPSDAEARNQANDWRMAVAQAAQSAATRGPLPSALIEAIDDVLEPVVDWRETLRDFMTAIARNDYTWSIPNRRHIAAGLYLPGMRSEEMGDVVLAVDTSGSVPSALLSQFSGEINSIMEDTRPESVHVVYCDACVNAVEEYSADDLPFEMEAHGRGGTAFRPVFDFVETLPKPPACLVYFTDMGACDWDALEDPGYPVLWADYNAGRWMPSALPFGQHMPVEELP